MAGAARGAAADRGLRRHDRHGHRCRGSAREADEPPTLSAALLLWARGITWAVLGWRRYVEPKSAAIPLGVLVALYSGTIAVGEYGWFYATAIGTASAVMAVSVPAQNPVLLGMGTVAMFGYVTSAVVRYLGDTFWVPAALARTGLLILGLALVKARRLRQLDRPSRRSPTMPRTGSRTRSARRAARPGR